MTPSLQEFKIHCKLCVPTPQMFPISLGEIGKSGRPFSRLLRRTAITELTVTSLVCYICAAEIGVLNLFLPSRFHSFQGGGRLRANDSVLSLLSRVMKAVLMNMGVLKMISDC